MQLLVWRQPANQHPSLVAQEIGVLQKVSFDRNIVQYYGACLEAEQPMLIMEYMAVRLCKIMYSISHGHRQVMMRENRSSNKQVAD